jgi:hypothetical protein
VQIRQVSTQACKNSPVAHQMTKNVLHTTEQEIGDYAGVCKCCELPTDVAKLVWTVSSAKPGYGVDRLRDDDLETFWQSDAISPHFINVQFNRRVTVSEIAIFCDAERDESYTPSKFCVRSGTNFQDLQVAAVQTCCWHC